MAGFDTPNMRAGKRKLMTQLREEAIQDFMAAGSAVKSTTDRGKCVVLSGSNMALAADGDEILGFLEGVEVPWQDNRIPVGVRVQGNTFALDSVGDLVVGDLVVSAAQSAEGVHPLGASSNVLGSGDTAGQVKKGSPAIHKWVVWEVYGTGANRPVLLRKA